MIRRMKKERPIPVVTAEEQVKAPCPHAGVCGGCLWQHISYPAQLRAKKDMINAAFANAGHEERISEVMASPDELYYRNRMDYVIGWRGEVGLKEYGSWSRYIDLTTCLLLDKETPTILQIVRDLMKDLDLKPWDAKFYRGNIRYCVIRLGKNTNERMISLVVHDLKEIDEMKRAEITKRLSPFATSLYLAENPEITDLSQGKTLVLLHGKEFLNEQVNGVTYTIHPNSFFQTNTQMAGKLQNVVLEQLVDVKNILDLYCGLGFFGIAAAKRGMSVYGHELDAPAIELAKVNAANNDVADKTRWGAGPTEALDWSAEKPDAVIIDPPRAGLHPKAVKALLENAPPKIVYVSCNYKNLVKELVELKQKYRVTNLQALDLFPQTPHLEVVATLVLN
jgi:23S rRNA (uracil-5-)-methyltransferase RumA